MVEDVLIPPVFVSWAEQAAYGTEEPPVNWLGAVQTLNPHERNNIQRHRHAGGLNYFAWTPGQKEYIFALRFKVNVGQIFHMVYGTEGVTGSDPYTHTLTPKRPLPFFTKEFAIPLPGTANFFTRRFVDCKVSKCTLGLTLNDVLIADFDCVALSMATYTTKTAITDITTKPYSFEQCTPTINSVNQTLMRDFSFTIDNGVKALGHIGSREANAHEEGGVDDTLTMDFTAVDDTLFNLMNADPPTQVNANMKFVRTAASDEFDIQCLDIPLEDSPIPLSESGALTNALTLMPLRSQLVIIDDVATY
ncbi:MAG: hypothetical protein KAQ99_00585 [Candidatus Aureabacteria bacterium]|nr:hypothetical protein [Candidatus Auribacterota bacterium]